MLLKAFFSPDFHLVVIYQWTSTLNKLNGSYFGSQTLQADNAKHLGGMEGLRGPPGRGVVYEISKSTRFHVSGFRIWEWISGFRSGFHLNWYSEDAAKLYLQTIMNHSLYANILQCHRDFTVTWRIGSMFFDCHTYTCHTACLLSYIFIHILHIHVCTILHICH